MKMMVELSKNDPVKGLSKIIYDRDMTCESCQKRMLTNSSFHSKNIVSTIRPLELLHLDLFGRKRTVSLDEKKCGLLIVDNFSKFT